LWLARKWSAVFMPCLAQSNHENGRANPTASKSVIRLRLTRIEPVNTAEFFGLGEGAIDDGHLALPPPQSFCARDILQRFLAKKAAFALEDIDVSEAGLDEGLTFILRHAIKVLLIPL
jgi:hypothetical protein